MKLKKFLKTSLIGASILAPITATTIGVVSCGHKKSPPKPPPGNKTTFTEFLDSANSETLSKIVQQTKPTGWDSLPNGDLSKLDNNKIVANTSITITLLSTSKNETAEFTATYITDTAYVIGDWTCSDQPISALTWKDFKTEVKAITPSDLYDQFQKQGAVLNNINIDFSKITSKDFTIDNTRSAIVVDDNNKKLTFLLTLTPTSSLTFVAPTLLTLVIQFNNVKYNINNWTLNYTKTEFQTAATKSITTDAWKNYATKAFDSSWLDGSCRFGTLKNIGNDEFTVSATHGSDSGTATLKFVTDKTTKKVMIYGEQAATGESNPWTFVKAKSDNWAKFKANVINWVTNGAGMTGTKKQILHTMSSNGTGWPPNWGKPSDNSWWTSHSFTLTGTRKPDDVKHIMFYTVSVSPNNLIKQYQFNILISENGDATNLIQSNFSAAKTQPDPKIYADADWFKDMKGLINNTSSDDLIKSVLKLGVSDSTTPNLFNFLNTAAHGGINPINIIKKLGVTVTQNFSAGKAGTDGKTYDIQFGLQFYLKTDSTKKPLTTGGVFAIVRDTTPQVATTDQVKNNGLTISDINA